MSGRKIPVYRLSPWLVAGILGLIIVAVTVIAVYSEGPGSATGSTSTTRVLPQTVTTLTPMTVSAESAAPLDDYVPGLKGRLLAVTRRHDEGPLTLSIWGPGATRLTLELPSAESEFSLDQSGRYLAFAGIDGDIRVYDTCTQTEQVVAVDASGLAWQRLYASPGTVFAGAATIAWIDGDGELRAATIVDEVVGPARYLGTRVDDGRRLIGWDRHGIWIGGRDSSLGIDWISVVDEAGALIAGFPAEMAELAPQDYRVLIGRHESDTWSLSRIGLALEPVALPWAPQRPGGEFRFAAWNRAAFPTRLAFIGYQGGHPNDWWMEVYDAIDGSMLHRAEFGERVWDVSWDWSDRFVVLAGSDDRGSHVVLLFDTVDGSLESIPQDGWVLFSALIYEETYCSF